MQPDQWQELLKFLLTTLQEGKAFTVEQAPQFVRELLLWKFYEHAFWCGIGGLWILAGLIAGQFFARYCAFDDDERRLSRWISGLIGLAIGTIVIATHAYGMVKINMAPRVVLVEMVRDLISNRR